MKKENEAVKDRIIRDIRNLFKQEEGYYKPVRVAKSNCYVEYESNNDRNKILSVEEYLKKIRPYLKDVNDLKKSDSWKIQLTIVINYY